MLEHVTSHDVAAEVKMVRSAFAGAILLVEGDNDVRFFERFTTADECILLPGRGKENVLAALEMLDNEDFNGVLAIIDADFWHILPPDYLSENLCMTDFHDIEVMIFETNALDSFLGEYGSARKIKEFLLVSGLEHIRETLYNIARPIGILRLISIKKQYNLKFDGLRWDRIINKDTLKVDVCRLIKAVVQKSGLNNQAIPVHATFNEEQRNQGTLDSRYICCGHDIIAIMSIGLRKAIGSLNSKTAEPKNIASAFRLAFDSRHLESSSLYNCVKQWEASNSEYKVFSI